MTDLAALIAKLEAAAEGSRWLSDRVLEAVGWAPPDGAKLWMPHAEPERPDPSRSIDDGVALVPEGYAWFVESEDRSTVTEKIRPCASVWKLGGYCTINETAFAATPALALSIAALKAQEKKS